MASIELCGVTKVFPDGTKAVDRLNLQVADGELLVLIGPSGSGKSTILRLIAGLEMAREGMVRIGGADASAKRPDQRNIAMVFQSLGLYGHLTVAQNLAFGLRMRQPSGWRRWLAGWGVAFQVQDLEIEKKVAETAALLGMGGLLAKRPVELSGGEKQRVALGRAMVRQPAAFLLDEPLSDLDAPQRHALRRELKELFRRLGATAIYVTHDQAEALALGDRIAVIRAGQLQQVGSPLEIYQQPANRFVASFFGQVGLNWWNGNLALVAGGLWFEAPGARWEIPPSLAGRLTTLVGREVTLGIRPEDLRLSRDGGGADAAPRLSVVVVDREFAGDAYYLRLRVIGEEGAERLIWAKADGACGLTPGETAVARIDASRWHWFDAKTDERLKI